MIRKIEKYCSTTAFAPDDPQHSYTSFIMPFADIQHSATRVISKIYLSVVSIVLMVVVIMVACCLDRRGPEYLSGVPERGEFDSRGGRSR